MLNSVFQLYASELEFGKTKHAKELKDLSMQHAQDLASLNRAHQQEKLDAQTALQLLKNNLDEECKKASRYEAWVTMEKDKITKLNGDVSMLQAGVNTLRADKAALQSELNSIKAESSSLPAKHDTLRAIHQDLEARNVKLQEDYDALVQTHDKCRERTKKSIEKLTEIEKESAQQVASAKTEAEEAIAAVRRESEKREDKLRKELREKDKQLKLHIEEAAQAKGQAEALQMEIDNLKQDKAELEQAVALQTQHAEKADERLKKAKEDLASAQRKVHRPAESKGIEDERLRANHNADQLLRLVKEVEKEALRAGVPPNEVVASEAELTVEKAAKAVKLLGTVVSRIHHLARQEVRMEKEREISHLRKRLSKAQASEWQCEFTWQSEANSNSGRGSAGHTGSSLSICDTVERRVTRGWEEATPGICCVVGRTRDAIPTSSR